MRARLVSYFTLTAITTFINPVYADNNLRIKAGVDYSSGKYGSDSSTDVVYAPFSVQLNSGKFSYALTIPYIQVSGDGSVVPSGLESSGSGSSNTTGVFGCANDNRNGANQAEDDGACASSSSNSSGGRTTESGLGDIVAALSYTLVDDVESGIVVDLTGRVKFPTASEAKNLGTGENDYALQGYIEKSAGVPYASIGLGYKWLGVAGYSPDTVIFGSVEGGLRFANSTTIGVAYDRATARVSGDIAPSEVSLFGSHRLTPNLRLSSTIYAGLSDASPDAGGGFSLGYDM